MNGQGAISGGYAVTEQRLKSPEQPRETVQACLAEALMALSQCRDLAEQITEKVNGPVPSAPINKGETASPSMASTALGLRNHAAMLRDTLAEISMRLA